MIKKGHLAAGLIGALTIAAIILAVTRSAPAINADRAAQSERFKRDCWTMGGTVNLSARNAYAGCAGVPKP